VRPRNKGLKPKWICDERHVMLIVCPGCKTRFRFEEDRIGTGGVKLRCGRCSALFRVVRKGSSVTTGGAAPSSVGTSCIRVVVANESADFCSTVAQVLAGESFDVHCFQDGRNALDAVTRIRPDVVLLDVALPTMFGFEVCDAIRKDPVVSSSKVILLASIYDKAKYKRSPVSLYGADDYIEKHHIPDSLAAMIYRLVGEQKCLERSAIPVNIAEEEACSAPEDISGEELHGQEEARRDLRRYEESETSSPGPLTETQLTETRNKAKRLARIIVSDIALYNQERVEEGVKNGSFFELLADDIAEGRLLFRNRVPEEIAEGYPFMDEAFAEFISAKKTEMGYKG
jgi:predicted Zn finger-like uncharacterized protein